VVEPLRIHGAIVRVLLVMKQPTEALEHLPERPSPGHTVVVVDTLEWRHRRMHIAVAVVRVELLVDDRRELRLHLHRPQRLRRIASHPRMLPTPVGQAADVVGVPVGVHWREVGVVRVQPHEPAEALHPIHHAAKRRIAATRRPGYRPEGETLSAITPRVLVVPHGDVLQTPFSERSGFGYLRLVIGPRLHPPQAMGHHVPHGRRRIGDVRQHLRELGAGRQKQALTQWVARPIGLGPVDSATVEARPVGPHFGRPVEARRLGDVPVELLE